jgi:thiol-disulfide isomerase/thioredoxin
MHRFMKLTTAVLLLVMPSTIANAEVTLKLGDPAPKLYVASWVQGGPIASFEKGTVYVVECWATWCGPCITAIPHVSKLNTQYKDKGVVFIGMNIWESNSSKVAPFVKKMGDKMNYNVALDAGGEKGKTAEAWMTASGASGIPHAFIVDGEGTLVWRGHPMSMDGALAKIVAGTYDLKAEIARQAQIAEKRAAAKKAADEKSAKKKAAKKAAKKAGGKAGGKKTNETAAEKADRKAAKKAAKKAKKAAEKAKQKAAENNDPTADTK